MNASAAAEVAEEVGEDTLADDAGQAAQQDSGGDDTRGAPGGRRVASERGAFDVSEGGGVVALSANGDRSIPMRGWQLQHEGNPQISQIYGIQSDEIGAICVIGGFL